MPILIIVIYLVSLFTVAFVAADVYLFREWYLYKDTVNDDYAVRCLSGAIALLLFSFSGRKVIAWLFSAARRKDDDPKIQYSTSYDVLEREDGSKIHIQYTGRKDGQPIVFIHGWNASSAEWYYQKKHLSAANRLILIDLPGLGKSTRPANKDFSLFKMASDVEAVIRHAKLDNVILYGHSIGGMIILTYCTNAFDTSRVSGIILEHTTYTNPARTAIFNRVLTAIQKPVLEPLCHIMIALSPLFWLSKWMSYMNGNLLLSTRFLTFTGTQTPQQLDFISKLSAMAPPAVFARGMLAMFRYDVTNALNNLRIPTLVISADKDRLTLPHASDELNRRISTSQIIQVAPAGHQGLIERHAEVNEAVSRFLEGLQSRPQSNPKKEKPVPVVA